MNTDKHNPLIPVAERLTETQGQLARYVILRGYGKPEVKFLVDVDGLTDSPLRAFRVTGSPSCYDIKTGRILVDLDGSDADPGAAMGYALSFTEDLSDDEIELLYLTLSGRTL